MKRQAVIVSRADIDDALQKLEQNNGLSKQKRRYDDEEPELDWHTTLDPLCCRGTPDLRCDVQTGGEQLRITTNQDIAGYPALKVRNFIKSYRSGGFFRQAAEAALDLPPEAAATLLLKLVDLGLIEEVEKRIDGELIFQATNYGRSLANASAAKPIYRKTGDRILEQLLKRVHAVNATSEYLYRVEAVVLFGSMLSDAERLAMWTLLLIYNQKSLSRHHFRSGVWPADVSPKRREDRSVPHLNGLRGQNLRFCCCSKHDPAA
jgi:hypothetical protein